MIQQSLFRDTKDKDKILEQEIRVPIIGEIVKSDKYGNRVIFYKKDCTLEYVTIKK